MTYRSLLRKVVWGVAPENSELVLALREVASILRRLFREARVRQSESEAMTVPILSDMLLLREYHEEQEVEEEELEESDCDVELLELCWRLASASYGFAMNRMFGLIPSDLRDDRNNLFETVQLRCPEVELLEAQTTRRVLMDEGISRPNFFVGLVEGKALFVSVRGTFDVGDVFTDVVAKAREFLEDDESASAHEGMANAADNLLEELATNEKITTALSTIDTLVFTGHSMGGGVALLAALQLQQKMKEKNSSSLVAGLLEKNKVRVRALAFSPPPVLHWPQKDLRALPDLESYYVQDDIVPTLSLRSILTFATVLDAIDGPFPFHTRLSRLLFKHNFTHLLGSRERKKKTKDLLPLIKPIIDDAIDTSRKEAINDPEAPLLSIPGRVTKFKRNRKDGSFTPVRDDVLVPHIRMKDRLLTYHMPFTLQVAANDQIRQRNNAGSPDHKQEPTLAVARALPPPQHCLIATTQATLHHHKKKKSFLSCPPCLLLLVLPSSFLIRVALRRGKKNMTGMILYMSILCLLLLEKRTILLQYSWPLFVHNYQSFIHHSNFSLFLGE